MPAGRLRVIAERRVQGYPWVIRAKLGAGTRQALVDAFTAIDDPQLLDLMRAARYVPVTPSDYNEIRQQATALGLLRALLGAVAATGTVRVGGRDPHGPARERRAIRMSTGFLRQGNDLVPTSSARLNILMATSAAWRVRDWLRVASGQVPRRYTQRLDALAVRHGIRECLPVPARQLSGGQRQRVALVRALLAEPRLLLADEPTTGLDPVTAAAAVDALTTVGSPAAPVTVIVATHDLAVARRFPRILAMRAGRLVYDGAGLDQSTATAIYDRQRTGP